MSEKRFVAEQVDVVNEDETEVWDIVFDTENTYAFMVRDTDTASDLCDLLNEQQATNSALRTENNHLIDVIKEYAKKYEEQQDIITELERKVKKYAKIGEEQLKQIMDLQDELNECRARPTLATDERGVVKVEYKCR